MFNFYYFVLNIRNNEFDEEHSYSGSWIQEAQELYKAVVGQLFILMFENMYCLVICRGGTSPKLFSGIGVYTANEPKLVAMQIQLSSQSIRATGKVYQ